MKKIPLLILLLVSALVSGQAFAKTRGVYVNGEVHFCFLSASQVSHQASTVDTSTWLLNPLPGHADATLSFSGYRYTAMTYGEGIAVFNDQIFYAFVANTSASSSAPLHCYVATYDLPSKKWLSVKDLGSVHMDNKSQGHNSGACVTVLNNQIYVFSDSGIYSSADGTSWASHPPLLSSSSNYQPLDAITIFPPDADPQVLVLVGYSGDVSNIYNNLDTELWNGKFGTDSQVHGMGISLGEIVYGHASLLQGTFAGGNSFAAGAKAPVIQLFVNSAASDGPGEVRRAEWTYSDTGGSWSVDPHKLTHDSIDDLVSFPAYTAECLPSPTSGQEDHIQRQNLAINYYQCTSSSCKDHEWKSLGFLSDAMVPQPGSIEITDCNGWGGTGNNTGIPDDPADLATLRKYWSLVGIVLGSPPFAVNGLEDYEIEDISNVSYGQSEGTEVQHSQDWENTVMFSAGIQVHSGFFDGLLKIEDQLDLGYKHAWLSSHEDTSSSSLGFEIEMGTTMSNPNDLENLGRYGWAIFNIPTLIVQDYALYAYDYKTGTGTGTYLNQDLHTTQVDQDSLSVEAFAFELENPGGPNDEVPGLLAGMGPFAKSTNLDGWTTTWESAGGQYATILGTHYCGEPLVNPLKFTSGAGGTVHFTSDTETVDTTGQTTDVDISDELAMEVGTKLKGFKVDLKAGYAGSFTTKVSNTTSFGSEVTATIGMKPCETPGEGCVSSLTIQPFWLKALDYTAPWVPAGYTQQLPWCMAWQVTAKTMNEGGQSGLSAPPSSGKGKVVGGAGGGQEEGLPEAGSDKGSSYSLQGGRMAWMDADGTETPIPLTADTFEPAAGATVSLNGFSWSSLQAQGKWTRQGQAWKFKTKDSVARNVVTLKLDFGNGTWDFDLAKADLSSAFRASEGRAHLKLAVNRKYEFYCDLDSEVEVSWDAKVVPALTDKMEVTRYKGSYDTGTGAGTVTLEGDLPENLDFFGDMGFEVNGHLLAVSLISLKDYEKALDNKKVLEYNKEGFKLSVDFKKNAWVAKFKEGAVHALLAPRWGSARIRVLVGGVPWCSTEAPVPNFTSKLKLKV